MNISKISILEAEKCLGCGSPSCQTGCPIETSIRDVINMYEDERYEEAADILYQNNPLSLVCAIVCNHAKQCEGHCVLNRKGDPVIFHEIEQELSAPYLLKPRTKKNDYSQRIAIIGSGPAGLASALILAEEGFKVTVYEKFAKPFGLLEYGIPSFRLDREILAQYRNQLNNLEVELLLNTPAPSINELKQKGFNKIILASGLWDKQQLNIEGENLANVSYSVDYLLDPENNTKWQNVAVIGAGNAAVDTARNAKHYGCKTVTMFARGLEENIKCSPIEIKEAREEGVVLNCRHRPVKITADGIYFEVLEGEDNSVKETIFHACEHVLIAIGNKNHMLSYANENGIDLNEYKQLAGDNFGKTNISDLFIAGDASTGATTVVHAVAAAKKACATISNELLV